MSTTHRDEFRWFHESQYGRIFQGDSYQFVSNLRSSSVDLIVTSPPFALVTEKEYGNVAADEYVDWFRPYAHQFYRVLKNAGSLVIEIGSAWNRGEPTLHLYQYKLVAMLCEEGGFRLAQDFYWWNPARLPTPAEWVNVRRVRVKDAVNKIWWLSKTAWPKASNRRVLQPYSESMIGLLENGYKPNRRPSGHAISKHFSTDNKAAIPPNLLAIANTDSNGEYLRYCRRNKLKPHPARFPPELPEFFIRMLTDPGDLVLDPFAGSCVTGEVCERLRRKWLCSELQEEYVRGALGRFSACSTDPEKSRKTNGKGRSSDFYRLPRVGLLWEDQTTGELPRDGGQRRARESLDVPSEPGATTDTTM